MLFHLVMGSLVYDTDGLLINSCVVLIANICSHYEKEGIWSRLRFCELCFLSAFWHV